MHWATVKNGAWLLLRNHYEWFCYWNHRIYSDCHQLASPLGVEPKSHIFYPQHINALMRRRYADYMRDCIFTARLTHWLIAAKPLGSRLNGFGNHSWRQLTHQATHCLIVTQTIAYCSDSRYHRSRPVIRKNASLNCRKPSAPYRLNLSGSRSASPYPGGYSFGFDSWQSRCR